MEWVDHRVQLVAVKWDVNVIGYIKDPSEKVRKLSEKLRIEGLYTIIIRSKHNIKVECQTHSLDEWLNFSEEEIYRMDKQYALDFYPYLVKVLKREFKL